jgi:hypothetical protein
MVEASAVFHICAFCIIMIGARALFYKGPLSFFLDGRLVRLWRRFEPVFGKLEVASAYYQRGLTDSRISDFDMFMAL